MKKSGLNSDAIEAELRKASGNVAAVARAFGVHRGTVKRFIDGRPSLRAVLHDCRETMKDNCESALYKAALAGESWAVCFYLKTQAKDHGYTERVELGHGNDVRQRVIEEVVPPRRGIGTESLN
jgi:hypothetical protein